MSQRRVRIAGVGTEPFVARSDAEMDELGRRALGRALEDAGASLSDVDLFVFGSRFQHPAVGQRVLAPLGPTGAPVVNTENACASGSIGFQIAMAYLQAGQATTAAVVGIERASEQGSRVPLPEWDRLGRAGVIHPARYALEASLYCSQTDTDPQLLAGVTVKNRAHAAHNPVARFQKPVTTEQVLDSPLVAEPLTRLQCCANADGAAAVIVTSSQAVQGNGAPIDVLAIASGSGVRSDRPPARSLTARLAERAYGAAGIGPQDVDVAEIYDAFSILEVLNTEALGFAPPGEAAIRIAKGEYGLGTDGLVTNPGGGLLGRGHPLGATGVAQLAEVVLQLQGRAGGRQAPEPRIGLVHTLGGNLRDIESNAGVVTVLAR